MQNAPKCRTANSFRELYANFIIQLFGTMIISVLVYDDRIKLLYYTNLYSTTRYYL